MSDAPVIKPNTPVSGRARLAGFWESIKIPTSGFPGRFPDRWDHHLDHQWQPDDRF